MPRRFRFFAALNLDPGEPPPSVIERAYQLARSGRFADIEEICRRLRSDGYRDLYMQFEGPALRAHLALVCRQAQGLRERANKGKPPPHSAPSRARRFELKAAECRQIANNAQNAETRQMYIQLGLSYEELAAHENQRDDPGKRERAPLPQTARS